MKKALLVVAKFIAIYVAVGLVNQAALIFMGPNFMGCVTAPALEETVKGFGGLAMGWLAGPAFAAMEAFEYLVMNGVSMANVVSRIPPAAMHLATVAIYWATWQKYKCRRYIAAAMLVCGIVHAAHNYVASATMWARPLVGINMLTNTTFIYGVKIEKPLVGVTIFVIFTIIGIVALAWGKKGGEKKVG